MQSELMRAAVQRLIRQAPFQPFVLNLENGDRVTIGHPENIAIDPGENGSESGSGDFCVISRNVRFYGTFDAIAHVALADSEGHVPS
ncbi:MAG TPA: hypothetical protein VGX76_21850 [Pirellulales bacterium]|jgi:hypothetical protein|nr:hypothetical protein [Pirellulales bacterium]